MTNTPTGNLGSIISIDDKVEVDVGNGITVFLKTDYSYDEEVRIGNLGEQIQGAVELQNNEKGEIVGHKIIDIETFSRASVAMIKIAIVGWSGVTDGDNKPVPWKKDYADKIRSQPAKTIITEIQNILEEKQKQDAEWEKKRGAADNVMPTGEKRDVPADSVGSDTMPKTEMPTESGGAERPAGHVGTPSQDSNASPVGGATTPAKPTENAGGAR